MNYTKSDLLKHFGTQYRLAKFLKISHQAVCSWPMEEPIPELRQLQLEKRKAEWLTPPKARRRRAIRSQQSV